MEDKLAEWLLDNRPYTHLQRRLKQFIIFCKTLEPNLGYTRLKRDVYAAAGKLLQGDLGRLWMRDRCYERVLRLYGANDQRTAAWHAKRSEMITASEVYSVLGTEAARREVMMRKLDPKPSTGSTAPPLLWGTRFEPVAKLLYEERTKCKITDVSCVQHPIHTFLGASPDGLIVPNDDNDMRRYGRLVEFKCPMTRKAGDEIPPGYVHQMQMQMECTGIDECEYVEYRFKQVNYSEWANSKETKGCFAVYEDGRVEYGTIDGDAQMIYWILASVKEAFVKKDPEWLSRNLPALRAFWDEVLQHRKNGTLPTDKPKDVASLDL